MSTTMWSGPLSVNTILLMRTPLAGITPNGTHRTVPGPGVAGVGPDPGTCQDARVTRLRAAIALLGLVVVVAVLAGLALLDPFHLRHARWFTAGLVALGLVLLTALLAVIARRGLLRGAVVLVGIVALVGWGVFVVGASRLAGSNTEVLRVADGGRSLVVLQGTGSTIDPVYAVVVRSGGGPFEQESLVYQGAEGSPPPSLTQFVDADTVSVETLGGCRYRSTVEDVTLAVDPVFRPLTRSSC